MKQRREWKWLAGVVVLAASVSLPRPARASLQHYFGSYNGHDYGITAGAMTWSQAEAEGVAEGGHLVTINDAAEEQWLASYLPGWYWIGFNDRASEGNFEWAGGEAVTYTHWVAGQPDNYLGNEDAAIMNWGSADAHYGGPGSGWNDTNENDSYWGILEFDPAAATAPVPEPSTYAMMGLLMAGVVVVARRKKQHEQQQTQLAPLTA